MTAVLLVLAVAAGFAAGSEVTGRVVRDRVDRIVATFATTDTHTARTLDQLATALERTGQHVDTRRVVVRRLRDAAATIRDTRIRGDL